MYCKNVINLQDELNADIVHVELYNDKKEIAYQSLIDSGVLVPK